MSVTVSVTAPPVRYHGKASLQVLRHAEASSERALPRATGWRSRTGRSGAGIEAASGARTGPPRTNTLEQDEAAHASREAEAVSRAPCRPGARGRPREKGREPARRTAHSAHVKKEQGKSANRRGRNPDNPDTIKKAGNSVGAGHAEIQAEAGFFTSVYVCSNFAFCI